MQHRTALEDIHSFIEELKPQTLLGSQLTMKASKNNNDAIFMCDSERYPSRRAYGRKLFQANHNPIPGSSMGWNLLWSHNKIGNLN